MKKRRQSRKRRNRANTICSISANFDSGQLAEIELAEEISFFPLLTFNCARLKILELFGVLKLAVGTIVVDFFLLATSGRFAMFQEPRRKKRRGWTVKGMRVEN